jgi:hypothetical protein
MNWTALSLILLALGALSRAEETKHYVYRPVSVSVFPLLSTNGPDATNVVSSFSLNIIGGYLGSLRGCEIGGVFNSELGDARGYQVAGAANIVVGDFTGLQQSGAVGVVGRDLHVLQQAGAFSMVVGNIYGCQMAGGACVGLGNVRGCQVSGGASVCAGRLDGLQLAGGVNVARDFSGAQIAPVNITGTGRGVQLGVVNVADDIDVPIGVVNVIKNGQFHLNAWTSEAAVAGIGIKTGSKKVYSVLTLGLRPDGDSSFLLAGFGLGGHISLNRFFVDIDGVAGNVYRWPHWFWTESADGYRFLTTLRVTGGWQVTDNVAITAGPTANLWLSSHGDARDVPMYGLPVAGFHGGSFALWPGFTAGLQLF